jgi:glycosyltransferase involved in cell wall biosynthesis
MCLTYGRAHLLEEAIASFLRQDYAGVKELIVLNDLPELRLHFDHPEVKIINVEKRFRGLGEKRNACAALCSHDLLFVWDDDDISLPWRLSYSVEKMSDGRRFFKPAESFVLSRGTLSGPQRNLFHSSSCWERGLFDEVNGYPHKLGTGEDIAIERKFIAALGRTSLAETLPVEDNFYMYRWDGTNSYHLSGFHSPSDYRMAGRLC